MQGWGINTTLYQDICQRKKTSQHGMKSSRSTAPTSIMLPVALTDSFHVLSLQRLPIIKEFPQAFALEVFTWRLFYLIRGQWPRQKGEGGDPLEVQQYH